MDEPMAPIVRGGEGASIGRFPGASSEPADTGLANLNADFAALLREAITNGAVPQSRLNLSNWPDIRFVMQGANGSDVALTCAPSTYWQTDAPQAGYAVFQVNNGGAFQMSILGLPLFNNYYTVFDRTKNPYGTINFAPIAAPA